MLENDSRSFKVIYVGITGKLVTSACYNKQQFCNISATVFTLNESITVKERLLGRTPL